MSDEQMPFVGDDNFAGPSENTVRGTAPLPSKDGEGSVTPEEALSEFMPKTADQQAKEYEEEVVKHGLSVGKARSILEDLLVRGYYQESVVLGPLTISFRTRTDEHSRQLYRAMEAESFNLSSAVSDFVSRYNLAGSLVSYGERTFPHPDPMADPSTAANKNYDTEYDARFEFLTKLPQQVVGKLAHMLFKFDGKIAAVLGDGAPQNF